MDTFQFIKPKLIEPGMKYFINSSLENCKIIKEKYYNLWYNLYMLLIFCLIIGGILYYKYKAKNNKIQKEEEQRKLQEYLMNKLRFMQDYKKNQINNLLTDLPTWQNNPEVQFYNRKIFT
jgi:hypothetical protein